MDRAGTQARDEAILRAASLEASMEVFESSISGKVHRFKRTGNPKHLLSAVVQVHREGRLSELVFTAWCSLAHRPSGVIPTSDPEVARIAASYRGWNRRGQYLTRLHLVRRFEDRFDMERMPDDFRGTRVTNIVDFGDRLLIGEYSTPRSARMLVLSDRGCDVCDYYVRDPGVRHIHAIHRMKGTDDLVITTGDASKYLDHWKMEERAPRFIRRARKRHAGHTAVVEMGGRVWMGTDFSSRPNWLETLDGRRWFFPEPAHRMFVLLMYPHLDRYLAVLSTEITPEGRHALSIFDTHREAFVHCEFVEVTRQEIDPDAPE